MKIFISLFLVYAILFMFGTTQAEKGRLAYTGATDPEQINGAVGGGGNISTIGDSVVIEGAWSTISTAPNTAARMPGNEPFVAAWKYWGMVEQMSSAIPDSNANGLTIKYYAADGTTRIDEYRMIIGNKKGNFELFWCTYSADYGNTAWTNEDSVWSQWGGCGITSVPVPIPICNNLRVEYNGQQYDVYYSVQGDFWVHVPEMTLKNEDLNKRDVTVDDSTSIREFQFPSRDSKQVVLEWLVIKGEGFPNFNKDVEVGVEDLGVGGRLVYSGETDLEQINGPIDAGEYIKTVGDTVKIKGSWSVISIAPSKAARMYGNKNFEAAWKYMSTDELSEAGTGSGLTIKYYDGYSSSTRIDEYRMIVGNNGGDLEVFWANWSGVDYGSPDWTENPDWATWGGASRTSVPVDVPDNAIYFRVTYDGNNYNVFYSVAGDLWVPVPDMRLHKDELSRKEITVDDPNASREFQFPSKGGAEVNLDWLVVKGPTFPTFNWTVKPGMEDLGGIEEEPRLFAYYPLDGDGDIAVDIVGGNNGMLYNYAEGEDKWVEGSPDGPTPDGGLYFDGVNDVVVVPNMLNTGSITTALWAQPLNVAAAWKGYIAYDRVFNAAWGGAWIGQAGGGGNVQFAMVFQDTVTGDTREVMFPSTEIYLENGWWTHIVCTYDENTKTRTTYIDGEFAEDLQYTKVEGENTVMDKDKIRVCGGNQIIFGMWNYQGLTGSPNGQANVILDEVQFYNYPLSPDEVLTLYETGSTAIKDANKSVPMQYELAQNYPNPFNPTTNISFSLPKRENVKLKIYDVLGSLVCTLVDRSFAPGTHMVAWDGTNSSNHRVSSGIYYYRLESESKVTITKKMVLMK